MQVFDAGDKRTWPKARRTYNKYLIAVKKNHGLSTLRIISGCFFRRHGMFYQYDSRTLTGTGWHAIEGVVAFCPLPARSDFRITDIRTQGRVR